MEACTPSSGDARDRESMAAIRRRDAQAFATLFDRYASLVLALTLRVLRDRAEVEEVLSDVFWGLWKSPEQFDPRRGSLATFLTTLARSRAIDRLRTRTRSERVVVTDEAQIAAVEARAGDPSSPFEDAVLAERRDRIRRAVGALSGDQRVAIEMAFYAGLSHSEIAESLGQPLGTVKGRIRNGLIRLRDSLRTVYGGQE